MLLQIPFLFGIIFISYFTEETMASRKSYTADFTQGSVAKHLLRFSTPLFLSNLLQVVYNMVDMIIVGQALGKVGLSGVSIGGDVSHFLTFIAMGFSSAGQVIISQYIGAKQERKVGTFIGTMFAFLFGCAAVLSIVCLLLRTPILHLMSTPAESFKEALGYTTVSAAGLIFVYGYNIVSAVLRGIGDSKHPFIFISIAAVMNIVLDLIFVFPLHMGAAGAALATVLSQGFSFICCAVFLWKRRDRLGFEIEAKDFVHLDREMLAKLTKLGIPMAIKSAAIQFSKLFVNSWINSYGVVVSAVAGIVNKFSSITNLLSNSVNTAGASMVGQNIGAEKYDRVPKVMLTSFLMTVTASILMSLVTVLFPEAVFGIFTDEADVFAVCMQFLPIAVLLFFGSAFRAAMNALLNGSGNYRINFVTAILDGMVMRIGLAVLLGLVLDMKYLGFWLGDALAGFTPFFIGLVYYFKGNWRTRKYVIKEE